MGFRNIRQGTNAEPYVKKQKSLYWNVRGKRPGKEGYAA
jgi:hypothetical protein